MTVEINTVFQQLVTVLDKIDPAKLNETLGAIATAFNGRGEKFGQTLVDFNALLAKIEPSLPNLSHDIEASVPAFTAYADAAPDLVSTIANTTTISNSIVDQQQNLDEFLVSAIGLADTRQRGRRCEPAGADRRGCICSCRPPHPRRVPRLHPVRHRRAGAVREVAAAVQHDHRVGRPHARRRALSLPGRPAEGRGQERRRELLRGARPARSARRTSCHRSSSATSAPTRREYGNQGILLNSDALKNCLFGPLDGPPRNTAADRTAGMTRATGTLIKFAVFGLVMALLTAFLFMVFGQYENRFDERLFGGLQRCVAAEVGRLGADRRHPGRHRRGCVAAARPQGARRVRRRPQHQADHRHQGRDPLPQPRRRPLPGTRRRSAGSTKILPAGSQIPVDRTAPALDLDLLLGGLKPVIQGLNPQDVNALTGSLVQILQGQGGTLESLFSKTSSFTNSLADNNQVIEQLIDNLRTTLDTLSKDGDEFSGAIDKLESLVNGLSADRDPIGTAIESLNNGTASLADLLGRAQPAAGRHGRPAQQTRPDPRQRQGPHRRHACRGCRGSTGSSPGSAPTAPSSRTTSVRSPSGPAIFRAGPSSSRGSSKKPEGAGKSRC